MSERGKCGEKHCSSVKHGGASVITWACKTAKRTGTLPYIDDFTAERSNRMNIEAYESSLFAHIQALEVTGLHLTEQ